MKGEKFKICENEICFVNILTDSKVHDILNEVKFAKANKILIFERCYHVD